MASIKDVERLADDLDRLVEELRSELTSSADFEKLIEIADEISEHADNAAQTFSTVNETLMSRIQEVSGGSGKSGQRSQGGQSKSKSQAAA